MAKIAVIPLGASQEIVEVGNTLVTTRLKGEVGDAVHVSDVFVVADGSDIRVGTPTVSGATVTLKILKHQKAKTVRVEKFKNKTRQHKVYGHRQPQTVVKVESIS